MRPRREARIDMKETPPLGDKRADHTAPGRPEQEPSLRDLLAAATARLRAAGIDSAALDARLLAGAALGWSREALLTRSGDTPPPEARARFEALLARRADREPVSRILGRREFWSLEFVLAPDTLDPRPDSETLVEAALALAPRDRALNILDLGTGSGCLLLALLTELPLAHGLGLDGAEGAVAAAAANADRLGLAGRARFLRRDWCEADWSVGLVPDGGFDLVVSNPPYIPALEISHLAPEVARFDPRAALDGGEDGLDAYRSLAPVLPGLLAADGLTVFEHGAGQGAAVVALVAAAGLVPAGSRADLAGIDRCVLARRRR